MQTQHFQHQQVQHKTQQFQGILNSESTATASSAATTATISQSGQYILVQRAGILTNENQSAPRASSAPPAQNQVNRPFTSTNLV